VKRRLLLFIAAGGAAGGVTRHALGAWVTGWAGTSFPVATLGVNLAGALLLGGLAAVLPRSRVTPETQALLTVGLCGGFTTFSTFSLEAVQLLGAARWGAAALYVATTAALGPPLFVLGVGLGQRLMTSSQR
jgi:fluoride exporter